MLHFKIAFPICLSIVHFNYACQSGIATLLPELLYKLAFILYFSKLASIVTSLECVFGTSCVSPSSIAVRSAPHLVGMALEAHALATIMGHVGARPRAIMFQQEESPDRTPPPKRMKICWPQTDDSNDVPVPDPNAGTPSTPVIDRLTGRQGTMPQEPGQDEKGAEEEEPAAVEQPQGASQAEARPTMPQGAEEEEPAAVEQPQGAPQAEARPTVPQGVFAGVTPLALCDQEAEDQEKEGEAEEHDDEKEDDDKDLEEEEEEEEEEAEEEMGKEDDKDEDQGCASTNHNDLQCVVSLT